jgi:chemotaxis protein histidine kinase CheA
MTAADEAFAREFARRSAVFVVRLPRQIEILSDELVAWLSAPSDVAQFEKLSRRVHQLKGAGSTFGCSSISDAARALEQRLAALQTDAPGGPASSMDEVQAAMKTLRGEANRIYRESAQGGQRGMPT